MSEVFSLDGVSPTLPEDDEYFIAPGARVIGRVVIGSGVGVWFNSVLRGDGELIEVGDGTNIQDGTIVHTDPGCPTIIGRNCTIGHAAIIHGCTLGDNVLVGMGATVLNNAKIGDNCLIGANALVTEGKEFPAGSLIVGSPAKAVRPLDGETIANLTRSAERYQANARRYRAGLKPL